MENVFVEVDFETFCKTCKYCNLAENLNPCCECLDSGYNSETKKPVNWTGNDV